MLAIFACPPPYTTSATGREGFGDKTVKPPVITTMIRRAAARVVSSRYVAAALNGSGTRRTMSDNVTYSGGQAGVQGGFYGAGGARSQVSPQ